MTPVVLARKYRPRSFEQMVGQQHVVQALTNALTSGRLHHAYLFTGTRGIGKTTVSRILAKSLNCTGADGHGGITAQPCGVCQACTEIDADRFIDYIELDAASNRSIDEIRELIERAAYKPSVGRYKVFMIDEAHQLTKDAFNALLKTLEEPPEYLKFVLATTDPEKMLPTVLSRCLQFNLRPMAPEDVQLHLDRVLQAERVPADAGALRLLARAARGSMRDALSLTDQAIAYGGGQLVEDGVRAMLGTVDRSHAQHLVQALARRDGPAVLATVAALREGGLSAAGTLEELARLLQQMAVEQVVPGAGGDDPEAAVVRQLAQELPPDETQLVYSLALHGRAELALVSDEYAALTMVLLRLFAFPATGSPAPVAAPRAAPLVAAPAVARASAPARPLPAGPRGGPQAHASLPAAAGPPAQAGAPSVARSAPAATAASVASPVSPVSPASAAPVTGRPAASRPDAPAARRAPADEPPPWMDDAPPPEDAAAAGWQGDDPDLMDPALADGMGRRRAMPPATPPQARALPGRAARAPGAQGLAEPARPARLDAADAASPGERRAGFAGALAYEGAADEGALPDAPSAGDAPAPAPAPTVRWSATALGQQWHDTVKPLLQAGSLTALVRELALQAELVAIRPPGSGEDGGPAWCLRVEREALRNPALRDKLAAALSSATDAPLRLVLEPGVAQDSIALREAAARESAQREAESAIRGDPAVCALLREFPTARIVPGSIQAVTPPPPAAPSPTR